MSEPSPWYPQLDRMPRERNSYVADYDDQAGTVALPEKAFVDRQLDRLPQSSLPAISTKEAVEAILTVLKV